MLAALERQADVAHVVEFMQEETDENDSRQSAMRRGQRKSVGG